jgi:PKD repeat protein
MNTDTRMFFVSVAFGLLVLFLASPVPAFQGFDDGGGGGLPGCATCHGTLANRGSGHDAHAALTNTCSDCHGSGAFNDPPLDNCVQCHGRDEDAGGDSESLGIGRGLRLHHVTTNAASCGSCHSDALGAAGVGENVLPSFYTAALGGAGLDSCDGSEERFTSLTVSLDNDGDGLADGNDPDCVANVAPVANAGGPYSGVVGSMIGFDGTASSDADGTIASYSWDFGDGGVASGPSPTHSYSVDGSFTVTLTVTDNDGLTGTDSTSAVINPAGGNTPPVAQANGPYSGTEGSAVQFSSSGSLDPDGSIVTYAWDFGDGSMSATANPSHTYVAAGTYNVSLTVTDDAGDSTSDATTATIEANFVNEPPTADANGPYAGFVGDTVVFDGSASTDADGAVVRYDWDFGDGIVAADAGPVPTHVYAAAGQFTVTLTVTDDLGATGSNSSSVTIAGRDAASDGETQYNSYCASCHGDPWVAPAVDSALTGAHRVTGARACSIEASIFGTYVFQDGAPGMQFLQGLANDGSVDAEQLAEYLNSQTVTGEQRYVTACAGCHGDDGSGGRTREGVLGESAYEIREAIREEGSMRFLACLPDSDIDSIAAFLGGNAGATDSDDDDSERDGGGGSGDFPFLLMLVAFGLSRMMGRRNGVRS